MDGYVSSLGSHLVCQNLASLPLVNSLLIYRLIDLGRKLDKIEAKPLKKIAEYLSEQGEAESAVSIYEKLGEHEHILRLYVDSKHWSAAFSLIEKYPQYETTLYLPYARWLVENDKFVHAQKGTI